MTKKARLHRQKLMQADAAGWVGAACLLTAYALVSFDVVSSNELSYQMLNIVAAIGLLIDGIARRALPSAATNAVWLIIAVVATMTILL